MTKLYVILLFSFSILCTSVQGQSTLSFQVIDDNDNVGIPFSTIYFPSLKVGYSANGMGYFSMEINNLGSSDSIVVSSLGYLKVKISVGFLNGQNEVRLKPDFKMLDEVVVSGKREGVEQLVNETDRFLKDYLGKDPYFLYAFYREALQHGEQYIGYTEAYGVLHVSGYQPSYNRKNKLFSYDLAQWKNIRRSEYSSLSNCDTVRKTIAIDKLLIAKSEYLFNGPLNKYQSQFEFTIDSAFSNNDSEILVVKFNSESKGYHGELWIDEKTNGLLSMKIHDQNINERIRNKCGILTYADFEIRFVMLDNEYFISYVSLNTHDKASGVSEELTIRGGEFKKNEVTKLNYDQRIIIYNEMLNPLITYDSQFWAENQIEVPSKIQSDLASKTSLQEQFFKMNGKRIIPLPDEFNSYEELYKKQDMFRVFMLNSDF